MGVRTLPYAEASLSDDADLALDSSLLLPH